MRDFKWILAATLGWMGLGVGTETVRGQLLSSHPDIHVAPLDPDINPLISWMPMSARLDYQLQFTNRTGDNLNFLSGKVRLYDDGGQLMQTLGLGVEEFSERSSFGDAVFANGRLTVDVPDVTQDSLADMIVDVNGTIWVAGTVRHPDGLSRVALGRFLPDGRLNGSFNGTGFKVSELKGAVRGLARNQGKNQLFVCGGTVGELSRPFISRHGTINGALAAGWGTDGAGVTRLSVGGFGLAEALVVDSDDWITVAGWRTANGSRKPFVARVSSLGFTSGSFGNAGIRVVEVPGAGSAQFYGVALDGSGRTIAAGVTESGGVSRMLVARLDQDGDLDPKFGEGGLVTLGFPGFVSGRAAHVRRVSGGKFLVTGTVEHPNGTQRFAVARLLGEGELDPDFGNGGRMTFGFPGTESSTALSATEDFFGRVIISGHATSGSQREFAVARLKVDGTLEPTFHGDGMRTIGGFGGGARSTAAASGILYSGDVGDIIVAGWAEVDDASNPSRWALARLDWNGGLNAGVQIVKNQSVRTDFLDFPFADTTTPPPYPGLDPKSAPSRVDVEMEFKELTNSVVFSGAMPRWFERNENTFQFPLLAWPGSEPVQLHVSQSHHFGQNHVGNPGQRYALDMIMYNPDSNSYGRTGMMSNTVEQLAVRWNTAPGFDPDRTYGWWDFNEFSLIYGLPVVAMAAGEVVFSVNNDPENFPAGTRDPASGGGGNSVIINHGKGELSFYAHMIPGSVQVAIGDKVVAGQQLGLVGNSGSSSGPHLHFHLMSFYPNPIPNDRHGPGLPMYFNNLMFATREGGPVVRQLRAELPHRSRFTVLNSPLANTSPGTLAGPGKLGNLTVGNTLQGAPTLVPPVQVTGTISNLDSGTVADAGDVAERIYAFRIPEAGTAQIRLSFPANHDLDFVVYDRTLRPRKPTAGKTRKSPEVASYTLVAGTYFILVSKDDNSRVVTPVTYTLDIGFSPMPTLSAGTKPPGPHGGGPKFQIRVPLPTDPDGEPIALLLPAVQKVREAAFSSEARWQLVETRAEIVRGEAVYEFDASSDGAEFFRVVYAEAPE